MACQIVLRPDINFVTISNLDEQIAANSIETTYPAVFVCANQYRFYKSHKHGVGNWRQLGRSYDRRAWPLVSFLPTDHAYFQQEIADNEEFFSLLIANLKCFSRSQDPSSKIVRRLLGADSEIRRMVMRVDFVYADSTLKRLDVCFYTAFKYTIDIVDKIPLTDSDTGQLTASYRNALIQFYRRSCSPQFAFIVYYENKWGGRANHLRHYLVGRARSNVVYDGCKFTWLGTCRPNDVTAIEIFLFTGALSLREAQFAKLTKWRPMLPEEYSIVHGPIDHTMKSNVLYDLIGDTDELTKQNARKVSSWTPLPYFSKRFHHSTSVFIPRLLALADLQLPVYVYKEIFEWVNDEASHLFLFDRIRIIQKLLNTVKAIKAARKPESVKLLKIS